MKKEFIGFYEPIEDEIDTSWNEGIFIFDANVLLNLYRYTESTRNDFLLVLQKLKDRLFMPHQVGLEFHTNRHIVIEGLTNSYSAVISIITEIFEKNINNQLTQFRKHPSIDITAVLKLQDDYLKKVSSELEKQKKNHPDFISKDKILDQITTLFENKIGKEFSKDDLKKIYAEGKDRYDQFIPPGYKDLETKRKKGDRNVYGDLIIWKEIIAFTKKEKKQIILITDDRKEDWWKIENGRTLRPREELIKEFYDLTEIRILIYNADNFLQFAKKRKLATTIKDKSITEVKDIRKSDENINTLSELINSEEFKNVYNIQGRPSQYDLFKAATSRNAFFTPNPSLADLISASALGTTLPSFNITAADLAKAAAMGTIVPSFNVTAADLAKAAAMGTTVPSFNVTAADLAKAAAMGTTVPSFNVTAADLAKAAAMGTTVPPFNVTAADLARAGVMGTTFPFTKPTTGLLATDNRIAKRKKTTKEKTKTNLTDSKSDEKD